MNNKITITGDGSWATALAYVLSQNGHKVTWHIRTPEIYESLKQNGINCDYLRFLHFSENKPAITQSLTEAVAASDHILIVIPSAFLQVTFDELPEDIFRDKYVISAVKGIIPDLNVTPCNYLKSRFSVDVQKLAFLSGPSHAEEVAQEKYTYLTVFSESRGLSVLVAGFLENQFLKMSVSDDVYGAEYTTALKNVMAVAVGICHGLGYGDNFTAVLVSAAIREIGAFIDAYVPKKRNITDFTYTGDLLVTCYSQHSRNRTFGKMIGRGYTVESAKIEMNMIAEGYYAVKPLKQIADENNINMPVCSSVYNILYKNENPRSEIQQLVFNLH